MWEVGKGLVMQLFQGPKLWGVMVWDTELGSWPTPIGFVSWKPWNQVSAGEAGGRASILLPLQALRGIVSLKST